MVAPGPIIEPPPEPKPDKSQIRLFKILNITTWVFQVVSMFVFVVALIAIWGWEVAALITSLLVFIGATYLDRFRARL